MVRAEESASAAPRLCTQQSICIRAILPNDASNRSRWGLQASCLEAILAHNLVEPGIIDGRKDVRKPRLKAWRAAGAELLLDQSRESPAASVYERTAF